MLPTSEAHAHRDERDEPAVGRLEARIRTISVIAPMRNEAEHIDGFVADLEAQDFEGELEILVADGRSTDGSGELLRSAATSHGLEVTILDNPDIYVSHGLNLCIRAARGDLIVRLDCHSRYPADYLRRCATVSEETGADNVGGILVPRGRTTAEQAVACAMTGPFGGVAWTRHGSRGRIDVDGVPYGAFRPRAFRRAGLFDESLVRNQDDEFNLRLRLAGGRITLDPSIRTEYTPRGSLRGVFRQYYEYGLWKPAVMMKHRRATSARSLVPAGFVISLAALATASAWSATASWLLLAILVLYACAAVASGIAGARSCGAPWRLVPRIVAVFPVFHFAYGLGTLVGAARMLLRSR